jgi:hypothetical protein
MKQRIANANGGEVFDMPADQAKALQAEWDQYESDRPMMDWEAAMNQTDEAMPRYVEDMWDYIGVDNAPQKTQELIAAKKAMRAEKP